MSEILCRHCFDTGLCYASETDEDFSFFMVCDCERGDLNQKYYIPRWNKEASRIFIRKQFLVRNWQPRDCGFWDLVLAWKEKISQAEQYWAHMNKSRAAK